MKRLLSMIFLVATACTTDVTEDIKPSQPQALISLHINNPEESFDSGEMQTRSTGSITEATGGNSEIKDLNIYMWRSGFSEIRHIYTTDLNTTFFSSYGTFEVRVVANLGESYFVAGVTDSPDAIDDPEVFNTVRFPGRKSLNIMSYKGQFRVDDPSSELEIELTRIVSKLSYTVLSSQNPNMVFLSAQICNIPSVASIFSQQTDCYPADNSYTNGEIVDSATGKSISDTFYMYENLKPDNLSIKTQKERIPENAPDGATYLLFRFYYPKDVNKIYTGIIFLGGENVSSFSIARNHYKRYTIDVYSINDIRVTTTTISSGVNNDDIIYTGKTENFDLANFSISASGQASIETGKWWLKVVGPASNDSEHLVFSTDGGASWKRYVAEDLYDISPTATAKYRSYRFALSLTTNFKNFINLRPSYTFMVYYGDAADSDKIVIRQFRATKGIYYPIRFNARMEDVMDWYLENMTIGGNVPDEFDSGTDVTYYMPAWGEDVYMTFTYPTYYTYLGVFYDNGIKMDMVPTDEEEAANGRVTYSGESSTKFCQYGPGTIWFTFEEIDTTTDKELRIPNTTSLSIEVQFDAPYTKRTEANYDVYTVPFGTTAQIRADVDEEFRGWTQQVFGGSSTTIVSTTGSCSVTMYGNYILTPTWYSAIALDANNRYANCYVVQNAGYYTFNAKKGGSIDNDLNPAFIDILWQDGLGGGSPEVVTNLSYNTATGQVKFKCSNDIEGSALIVAKDTWGKQIWSWHIWRTNYTPGADSYGLMTRNLGALRSASAGIVSEDVMEALRAGYIYQPGRHEPFPFIMAEARDDANTFSGLTFVTTTPNGPTEVKPGYSSARTNWNTAVKGKEDPCPYGWRVPKMTEINGTPLNIFSNANTAYNSVNIRSTTSFKCIL